MTKKQKKVLIRIIISTVLLAVLMILEKTGILEKLPFSRWTSLGLFLIPYLVIGYDILKKAGKGIIKGRMLDECFLMAVATIGAFALSEYEEGAAVMLFYQIGELFQSVAVGKSRKNISDLMDIRPDYANKEVDGSIEKVDPDEVSIGDIIVVQPGEKVPLDGKVLSGNSSLDTKALTGESVPRSIKEGEEIISGCINLTGVLRIEVTKEFGESTVSKILELVENASSRKSKSENFISKFARVYTPVVCFGALALAILPPVIRLLMHAAEGPMWSTWVLRGLTFLVISCPCALVISIPLSFFAGIGAASHAGILVKGSNYLERLANTQIAVFDKTGTITKGEFEVSGVHHNEREDEEILRLAAYAECASSHPIAVSLRKHYGKEIDRSLVEDYEEISGEGITAKIEGKTVAVGNEKLMRRIGAEAIPCNHVGTIVHIAIEGSYAGHILIADGIKEGSKEAIEHLKKIGVRDLVMLTGDAKSVGEAVAKEVGMTDVHTELMPGDKVSEVEKLMTGKTVKETLLFVGDGINDAPVLTRADVGVAMGALGSDAAIEAADVVLMDDDLRKLVTGIQISKKTLRIVYENIALALLIKLACLGLGALGFANMWWAIFADVGVMILAVCNSIRALRVPKIK
ncbi:MAG: cadmium-translocating P-type ATPase [Lachnospiraceae bacterium]|nr:cadmium-translocating P-type ATPase [Lachnospiraceae bacterium]